MKTLIVFLLAVLPSVASAQVQMGIDGPAGDVTNPFVLCGFAIDKYSAPRSGIASVNVLYQTPNGSVSVTARMGLPRPDIAATYQWVQDANLGWCAPPMMLPNGTTTAVVTVTGNRAIDGQVSTVSRMTVFTVNGQVFNWINNPKQGDTGYATIQMMGVARDMNPGASITSVKIYAVPRNAPDSVPVFMGNANYGEARPGTPWDGFGWSFVFYPPFPQTYDLISVAAGSSGHMETRYVRVGSMVLPPIPVGW